MAPEPRLTDEDRRIWRVLQRTAAQWATTRAHRRRVAAATTTVKVMAARCPNAYVAWSGGKDSTVMAHLVRQAIGGDLVALSIKDDLDFPGEKQYVRQLADAWGLHVDVVSPPFSLQDWIRDHADELDAGEDMHSRSAAFSRAAFYDLIDRYREQVGSPGVYLGLRSEESRGRAMNRALRGVIYEKVASAETVCTPIADWRGLDVYAYAAANSIPLLPMYRCVRFHDEPWRVRKSWWLPGSNSRHGGMIWLRAYYPSLYLRLCELLPDASQHA